MLIAVICLSVSLVVMSGMMVGLFVSRLQEDGIERLLKVQRSGAALVGAEQTWQRMQQPVVVVKKKPREGIPGRRTAGGTRQETA